jgi:hypothetical protein
MSRLLQKYDLQQLMYIHVQYALLLYCYTIPHCEPLFCLLMEWGPVIFEVFFLVV